MYTFVQVNHAHRGRAHPAGSATWMTEHLGSVNSASRALASAILTVFRQEGNKTVRHTALHQVRGVDID